MSFRTESGLFNQVINSQYFKELVNATRYPSVYCAEPKGLFGIPDLVVANFEEFSSDFRLKQTFAFEMKLSNWRRALIQAYKYQAFANLSYVVIDQTYVNRAIKNLGDFALYNVGLISVDHHGCFCIHHIPVFSNPFSAHVKQKFEKMVSTFKLIEPLTSVNGFYTVGKNFVL